MKRIDQGELRLYDRELRIDNSEMRLKHKDSVERFDDFRRRKSRRNDDFRGQFYGVTELAFFGAEN